MSNNSSIKLYTEDQMRKIFRLGYRTAVTDEINEDFTIDYFRPIELPTDEEIHTESIKVNGNTIFNFDEVSFRYGAKYVIDKISGGNK
jgi:hypothetical protein